MYRTPNHEPRYKHRTCDREVKGKARRYEEPRESSEGSSSDEDEESTDRYTEESEDTTESRQGRGDCEWDTAGSFDRERRIFPRAKRREDVLMRAYYADEKVQKHDKITQKDFLSPFPSFLIPPIYREVAVPRNYRYVPSSSRRENRDDSHNFGKPPKSSPRKADSYEDEEVIRVSYPNADRKLCEKHRAQRDIKYFARNCRRERILTCVQKEAPVDPSSTLTKNAYGAEGHSRQSPRTEGGKKPKSVARENKPEETSGSCKDCLQEVEKGKKPKRGEASGANQPENAVDESFSGRRSPHGAPGSSGSGKVREKLVYVVEEEGKDVTKLETDLFSVNEILTIKKDLLELSEFAKKLKKLKEMKRDSEKGKADKSACQCKPVEELLKNVNKRIEALEARQEELERGSRKPSQKGDTETESKKTSEPKMSSDSPPKTPVVRKQSAMTDVPSFPKTEMIVSRANFSNNSEIVNELMDIKTHLQKLEKRRMSKEITPEAAPLGESKITKKKDHAIAVFSSRTYILTAENFKNAKNQLPIKAEVKISDHFPAVENARSRTEQAKENVANWLKTVSPIGERSEKEIAILLETEEFQQEMNTAQPSFTRCPKIVSGDGFENQEPQKNRASEVKPEKQDGISLDVLMKKGTMTGASNRQPIPHLTCKECVMTPSGRLFVKAPNDEFLRKLTSTRKVVSKNLPSSHSKPVRRSASSCSVCSPVLAKERVRRLKKGFRDSPRLMATHSKSTQELIGSSSGSKDQKTLQNTDLKKLRSALPRDKLHKESQNELVKRRESNLIGSKSFERGDDLVASSSFSELIRTVNLDTEKASDSMEGQNDSSGHGNDMQIYSLATMTKLNLKRFELGGKEKCMALEKARERERERKRLEEEALIEAVLREAARREEARREAERKEQMQIPGCSNFDESAERGKIKTLEEEYCECVCCCKKKLKPRSCEGSGNDTSGTANSSVGSGRGGWRERRRRKRECNKELKKAKKLLDAERKKRKKERKVEKRCEVKCKAEKKSKEKLRKKKSKECLKKSRSKEKCKKKKVKECLDSEKRARKLHRCTSQTQPPCQAPPDSSSCATESLPCKPCSPRQLEQPCEVVKPTVSIQEGPKKRDSLEILKRPKINSQTEKGKLLDESCMFRNIFKNLRKLYPKFSGLQLGNFYGEFPYGKSSQQQAQIKPSKYVIDVTSEEDDDDDYNCYCGGSSHVSIGQQHHHYYGRHNNVSPYHYYEDYQRNPTKSEHLKNCKCVRVYLQTQGRQEWPGVLPFRSLSKESVDKISKSGSSESRKTIKSDFIFPGRLPRNQFVGHSSERRRACRERRKCYGECRRRCKKRCRKNLCVCNKCANVHKRKKRKKRTVTCDDPMGKSKLEDPCKNEVTKCLDPLEMKEDAEDNKASDQLHFPLISFLKNFCKSKPRSKPSICKKLSNLRLKLKRDICFSSNTSVNSCRCATKLCAIEDRLKCLEQAQAVQPQESCRRKRRRRRRCGSYEEPEIDCEKRRRRGRRKRKRRRCCDFENVPRTRKKRRRRKKRFCDCPEVFSDCNQQEIQTFYCTCNGSDKTNETTRTNETNESLTTKTTTTTSTTIATTGTTATTEDTESSTLSNNKDNSLKKDWRLKERLSSIQFMLNNFQKYRKAKPQPNNSTNIFVIKEPDVIDDCSKNGPMPRTRLIHELKPESSSFLKKIKKLRKNKKNKKTDKREKEPKEKQNLRSAARGKKCKC